jgi:hypothetical protein
LGRTEFPPARLFYRSTLIGVLLLRANDLLFGATNGQKACSSSEQSACVTIACSKAGSASAGFASPTNACRASGCGTSPSICPADSRWAQPGTSTRPRRSSRQPGSSEGQDHAGAARDCLQHPGRRLSRSARSGLSRRRLERSRPSRVGFAAACLRASPGPGPTLARFLPRLGPPKAGASVRND